MLCPLVIHSSKKWLTCWFRVFTYWWRGCWKKVVRVLPIGVCWKNSSGGYAFLSLIIISWLRWFACPLISMFRKKSMSENKTLELLGWKCKNTLSITYCQLWYSSHSDFLHEIFGIVRWIFGDGDIGVSRAWVLFNFLMNIIFFLNFIYKIYVVYAYVSPFFYFLF